MKKIINHQAILPIIDQGIQTYLTKQQHPLALPIQHAMTTPGKRIRPLLLLLTYQLFQQPIQDVIDISIGIEILHNFTLIHDDIMDHSSLRRGKITVYKKWDEATAILAGDMMLCHAFRHFSMEPKTCKTLLNNFCTCVEKICKGQQQDMLLEKKKNEDITEEIYLAMIYEKTAHFFGFCMQTGGLLAKTSTQNIHYLYQIGLQLGIIFQLQDDLLDIYGNDLVGKNIGQDITNNKKTFLYIKAFSLANDTQKNILQHHFQNSSQEESKKIKAVKTIFDQLNLAKVTQKTIDRMKHTVKMQWVKITDIHPTAKQFLENFMDQLFIRQK